MYDSAVLAQNPNFASLFTELNDFQLEKEEALYNIASTSDSKLRFLENQALLTELEDLAVLRRQFECGSPGEEFEDEEMETVDPKLDSLRESISFAESRCFLETCETKPLGLSETDLVAAHQSVFGKNTLENVKSFLPLLEDAFVSRCGDILDFYYDNDGTESKISTTLRLAKASKLAQVITDKKADMVGKRVLVMKLRQDCLDECQKLLKALHESIDLSSSYLLQIKSKYFLRRDEIYDSYFSGIIKNMLLKLRVLKLELLQSTFTEDVTEALRRIRGNHESKLQDAHTSLESLRGRLAQYTQSGPMFAGVVKEYARCLKEIESIDEDVREICKKGDR